MDQLHINKAHVIGYGMGGGVALHLAVSHQHRNASLTSIGQCGFVASRGLEQFEPEWLVQNGRHKIHDGKAFGCPSRQLAAISAAEG
ncbi:hypothetical protein [Paenibacillus lautus]|uniref:hypothetical protein n=1 Tax=Paenibacillus TaxID=44249 RepID=UPI0035578840